MTTKHLILLQDDTDGSEASETVQFGIDGASFEIDLSDKNAKALRKALNDWVSHARKVGGRAKRGTATKTGSFDGVDNKAVRAWAKSAGIDLSTRGRIPADVVDKYRAAGH